MKLRPIIPEEEVPYATLRRLTADCRRIVGIDEPAPTLTYADFRPYQVFMANRIVLQRGVLLGAEMGLGKTGATLRAVYKLLTAGKIKKVLIVAPLFVAENVWPEELQTWDFCQDLTFSVITGTPEERAKAAAQDVQIHIINRENVVWLQKHLMRGWDYDMLVYDEASRLKGGRVKTKPTLRKDGTESVPRLSEFGALRRMRWTFKKVVLLTGTPAPNGLIDLWGPVFMIDNGDRLGRSMNQYKKTWFVEDRERHKIEPRPNAKAEIMARLEGLMYSLKTEDYIKLPPLISNNVTVNLPPKALDAYRRLETEMALEEHDIEAVSKGVLSNKLQQMANGVVYDSNRKPIGFHEAKIAALESIIREAEGEPVLVAYSFRPDMDVLRKHFKRIRLFGEGTNDYRDWNAGRIPLMMAHPASIGHGLNMQKGGHIAVWYGLTWSLELYQQFNKRLHRSGQKNDRVFLHHILAKGTADMKVLKALQTKGATQDTITATVRAHIRGVRQRELALAA